MLSFNILYQKRGSNSILYIAKAKSYNNVMTIT